MTRIYSSGLSFSLILLLIGLVGGISVGQFLSLTYSEKAALDKFRTVAEPILKDDCMKLDTYLVRWLRARDFDVDAALQMLRQNLKWRKEEKIEKIKHEVFTDIAGDYHLTLDTYDKIGQPIGVVDIYDWDIRRAIVQGKGQRLLRFVIGLVENIAGQVCERQNKGLNVTQVVVLFNADGFNIVEQACPICLPLWIQFVTVTENYYPEWIDEFIIIDGKIAPQAIQIVLNVVRSIFSKNTRNAIKIFGPNKKTWMAHLDRKISRDERRKEYGGTKPPYQY